MIWKLRFLLCVFSLISTCLGAVCDELLSRPKPFVSLPSRRSLNLLHSLPLEVKEGIFSFLTHEVCAFGLSCRSLLEELDVHFERKILKLVPSLKGTSLLVKALVCCYFLEDFEKELDRFSEEPVSQEDVLHLCFAKAESIDEVRADTIKTLFKKIIGLAEDEGDSSEAPFRTISLLYYGIFTT